jgi:hypothetical protein
MTTPTVFGAVVYSPFHVLMLHTLAETRTVLHCNGIRGI